MTWFFMKKILKPGSKKNIKAIGYVGLFYGEVVQKSIKLNYLKPMNFVAKV